MLGIQQVKLIDEKVAALPHGYVIDVVYQHEGVDNRYHVYLLYTSLKTGYHDKSWEVADCGSEALAKKKVDEIIVHMEYTPEQPE
jgi:hypothetical protein